MDCDGTTLRVYSDVLIDGSYGAVVAWGERVRALTRTEASIFSAALVAVAQRAEFYAAVRRQMSEVLEGDEDGVRHVLAELVRSMNALNREATLPLAFEPGLNPENTPFIKLMHEGEQVGQLDPQAVREYAMWVLEAAEGAYLDGRYFGILTSVIGLEEEVARSVVGALATFRPPPPV